MKETNLAGANYIVNFFNDIQLLLHSYSNYINYLLELESKTGDLEEEKEIDEEERKTVFQLVQSVRYYCHKTYIGYNSICQATKIEPEEKIKKNYNDNIKNSPIIDKDKIEEYVISLNAFLVHDIIKDLLTTSHDIMGQIYGNQTTEKTGANN